MTCTYKGYRGCLWSLSQPASSSATIDNGPQFMSVKYTEERGMKPIYKTLKLRSVKRLNQVLQEGVEAQLTDGFTFSTALQTQAAPYSSTLWCFSKTDVRPMQVTIFSERSRWHTNRLWHSPVLHELGVMPAFILQQAIFTSWLSSRWRCIAVTASARCFYFLYSCLHIQVVM